MAEKTISGKLNGHPDLLKQSLRALEQMRQKLDQAESRARQPIAIIGMGCRFPGGVDDASSFWDLLKHGREAISEIPSERWSVDDYYDPNPSKPGTMVSRFGGFLNHIDLFDAAFFGIAPREAAMMDPQQRLLLEVVWEALEGAGLAPRSLSGSRTGMYLGIASGDYAQMQLHAGDASLLDVHYASGSAHSIASGRVSYLLGLKGPSVSVDTACSSSLVAVHLACQALRAGECTLAIAGGVNIILAPETTVALSQAYMLSPDGRSKAFDDRADGFARAEGCGVVILKPLDKAQADGDPILAVIRGTALNQDGASSSLTAPNGPSQEDLMRRALEDAGKAAIEVNYVEAHGTGTALGDPIELRALGSVYGATRKVGEPVFIGSLKTNFGHMEAAAGIGGLIKLVLALQEGQIPAHLQFQKPTCHVPWDQLGLTVPRATMSWPATLTVDGKLRPRVGAVSSFGFSGTNAHLIVEQPSVEPLALADTASNAGTKGRGEQQPRIMPLSASCGEALQALIERYLQWLNSAKAENYEWDDITLTAARSRNHLRHRTALVAGGKDEAKKLLLQLSERDFGKAALPSPLCFLFTGQGSERSGMGLDLLRNSAVFSAAVQRLENALDGQLKCDIATIWANQNGELERASLVQPALYAYGWALSELWRSWGVEPGVVLGHSLGEYLAATVAGVMTPEEGIRLVAARGRLTETLGEPGGMVAIQATEEDLQDMLTASSSASELSIAAVNAPSSIVVSGRHHAIQAFEDSLRQRGLRHKRLRTTHGFHSVALEGMLDSFAEVVAKIPFRTPQTRWISNLTGEGIDHKQPIDPQYWRQHLSHTVEFQKGLAEVEAHGPGVFLELGAEPQLLALCEANGITGERRIASISKSGPSGEWQRVLSAASQLYALGFDLDWKGISEGRPFRRVPLPTYPFQRKRFWFSDHRPAAAAKVRAATSDRVSSGHPLLGTRLRTHAESMTFHAELTSSSPAHLADHRVLGRPILPGAAYLEMAVAAAQQINQEQEWTAVEVEFREACAFDVSRLLETVVSAPTDSSGRRKFEIASCPLQSTQPTDTTNGLWTLHATGYLDPSRSTFSDDGTFDLDAVRNRARAVWDRDAFYSRFQAVGLDFGLAFQPVVRAWESEEESLVAFELLPSVVDESKQYRIHPVALDACLQAAAALDQFDGSSAPALPAALAGFHFAGDPSALRYAHAKVRKRQGRALTIDITGLDADGKTLLFVEGLTLVAASGEPYRGWLHQVEWEQVDLPIKGRESIEGHEALHPPISIDPDALRNELTASAQRHDLEAFDRWMGDFDELCAAWIAQSFEQGGMVWTPGRQFQANDLLTTLRIAPKHLRLARRLLEILSEFGYLETIADDGFRVLPKIPLEVEASCSRLRVAHNPEMAWTERTSSKLLQLLRGEVSAVDVLFSEDGERVATRLYRESVVARTLHPAVVLAVVQAAEQRNGKARVLEVGGGTAATTSYLVPALTGKIADYLFTDLGAGFVNAARREFGTVPGMRFQTLDLERAPAEQGLDHELFDIVIASNVIHATRDLKQTMHHLRSVLAPGGLLLMAETVGKQPWVDLTVGFTEGWWRFVDHDLRPQYALIGKQAWISLLNQSAFGNVVLIPDQQQGILSRQCLIAAVHQPYATPARAQEYSRDAKNQVLIVTASDANDPLLLAQCLHDVARTHGAEATLLAVEEVSPAAIEAWFQSSGDGAAIPFETRQIFYLPGAEVPSPGAGARGEDRLAWQQRILGGALALTKALLAADRITECKLWLVSRGASGPTITAPDGASLAAFTRSLCSEYPNAQATAIDLESVESPAQRLWQISQDGPPNATQLALRADSIWAARLVPYTLAPRGADRNGHAADESETRRLRFPGSGLLADLNPSIDKRRAPGRNEVEIAISAAAINFHEVLSALQPNATHSVAPGGECAGVIVRVGEDVQDLQIGDAVVAIGSGLMADFATLARKLVWKKPAQLSTEDAATLLIPFLTARWSLERVAKLKPGERVLIHAGAGGVGMAAIQEAKRFGAMVYATAGSEAKRALLRAQGLAGVFDSRSTAFESEVLLATGFHGVEVVLNSLGGDKIAAGLRCLAPRGRFIELGEHPLITEEAMAIRPDVIYLRVHLRAALGAATPEVREIIASVLRDAENEKIQPLPWKRFDLAESPEAFRFMAAGRHTGRVLLGSSRKPTTSFQIRRDGAYIVTGGLTGLGRLTVEWLASRGAGCVLVLSRSEADREIQTHFARLEDSRTTILIARCDVSDSADLAEAMKTIPPTFVVRGIFHAAGVVDDAGLPQQTPARFRAVLAAKVAGAWNLHSLAASATLDCFVLFSSAAGVFGARGQANHAAANACLDALAHYRRQQLGLVALSVNWGAWSGTGAAVRHNVLERSERLGITSISPSDGFSLLERLLEQDCTQMLVSSVNWPQWAEHSKAEAAANRDLLTHLWQQPTKGPVSASFATVAQSAGSGSPEPSTRRSWRDTLLAAQDAEQPSLLEDRVEEHIRAVLSLAGNQSIDSTRPLQEYGLDSLLSIELRNALSADLEAKLPATLLFDYPTLASLTSWLFHDVLKAHTRKDPAEIAPEPGVLRGIASLSDDEVEKLFQQKMVGMGQ